MANNLNVEYLKDKVINLDSMLSEVRVFAPATVANMICGFDILGFAVEQPGDEVVMRRTQQPGVRRFGK